MVGIADLAAAAGLPGVDWNALYADHAPDGTPLSWFWTPAGAFAYVDRYVEPAYARAMAVLDGLELVGDVNRYSAEEVRILNRAFDDALSTLNGDAGSILSQAPTMSLSEPFRMPLVTLQAALIRAKAAILVGTLWHAKGAPQLLVGNYRAWLTERNLSMDDANAQAKVVAAHADNVVKTCNAIVKLNAAGILSPLRKPVSGLGATGLGVLPLVAWVVIGVVAVVIVFAALLYFTHQSDQQIAEQKKLCDEASARGDTAVVRQCLEVLTPKTWTTDIAKYGAMAAMVICAIYFAPRLVQAFKQSRRPALATNRRRTA